LFVWSCGFPSFKCNVKVKMALFHDFINVLRLIVAKYIGFVSNPWSPLEGLCARNCVAALRIWMRFPQEERPTSVYLKVTWTASPIRTSYPTSCCSLFAKSIPQGTVSCRIMTPNILVRQPWHGLKWMKSTGGIHHLNHR